jgi:hypothetical protein
MNVTVTKAANLHRNEVNWLLRETAKKAIGELKPAGFADSAILVAIQDQAARENFVEETQAIATSQFPAAQVRSFSCSKQNCAPRTL